MYIHLRLQLIKHRSHCHLEPQQQYAYSLRQDHGRMVSLFVDTCVYVHMCPIICFFPNQTLPKRLLTLCLKGPVSGSSPGGSPRPPAKVPPGFIFCEAGNGNQSGRFPKTPPGIYAPSHPRFALKGSYSMSSGAGEWRPARAVPLDPRPWSHQGSL